MNEFKNEKDFEKALVEHLNSQELDKKSLSLVARHLVSAFKAGLTLHDWHIKGQPPRIDELIINGSIKVADTGAFSKIIGLENWKDIHILRRGIPVPHELGVKVTFEPRQL